MIAAAMLFLYNKATGERRFELVNRLGSGFSEVISTPVGSGVARLHGQRLNADAYTNLFLYDPVRGFWIQALNHDRRRLSSGTRWAIGTAAGRSRRRRCDQEVLTDMFVYNVATGVWVKCLVDGGGGFGGYSAGNWDPGWTFFVADLNGDGRDDFFLYNRVNGVWVEAFSQAGVGRFDYPASGQWDPGWRVLHGDLDGDGSGDLFLVNVKGVPCDRAQPGQRRLRLCRPGAQWSPGWTVSPGDLNGDGSTDLFLYNPAGLDKWGVDVQRHLPGGSLDGGGRTVGSRLVGHGHRLPTTTAVATSFLPESERHLGPGPESVGTAQLRLFESGNWGTGWTVYARTP